MRLAVASGKGGTGKTMIAVSLALSLTQKHSVAFIDADVEAPNAHLFLKPQGLHSQRVSMRVPEVDSQRCNGCGLCADLCAYNALAVIKGHVLLFTELCHGCGGCTLLCPRSAMVEVAREIGVIESGSAGGMEFSHGKLNIGEVLSPLIIGELKAHVPSSRAVVVIDAPPGTSCPMVEVVSGCDFCLLVTEPTPFGQHDLEAAVEVTRTLGIRTGVVVNRCDQGDDRVYQYCRQECLPIVAQFPFNHSLAQALSRGIPAWDALKGWRNAFTALGEQVLAQVESEGAASCNN